MAARKDNGQGSMYYDEGKGYWYAEIQWKDSITVDIKSGLSAKNISIRQMLELQKDALGNDSLLILNPVLETLGYEESPQEESTEN